MHVRNEVIPLGISNCGGGSGGCILIAALSLLFHAFLTFETFLFLVIASTHMVLAPMVGAIVVLLLMRFAVLGRYALPLLIFLLLTFVCSVFLILFLSALFIPLFFIVSFSFRPVYPPFFHCLSCRHLSFRQLHT